MKNPSDIKPKSKAGRRPTPVASPMALAPIQRETMHHKVYRALRDALIYGRFAPGEVLTISELADSLDTSTMPVRDALARLISEQALEEMPNRSVRVPLLDRQRLADLKHARSLVENEALALAAKRLTSSDYKALYSTISAYAEAMARRGLTPIEGELEANRAFHFTLYQASGSSVMMPIIESLWLQSGPVLRTAVSGFDPSSGVEAPHYHQEILVALEAGNLKAAHAALDHDISRAFDIVAKKMMDDEHAAKTSDAA